MSSNGQYTGAGSEFAQYGSPFGGSQLQMGGAPNVDVWGYAASQCAPTEPPWKSASVTHGSASVTHGSASVTHGSASVTQGMQYNAGYMHSSAHGHAASAGYQTTPEQAAHNGSLQGHAASTAYQTNAEQAAHNGSNSLNTSMQNAGQGQSYAPPVYQTTSAGQQYLNGLGHADVYMQNAGGDSLYASRASLPVYHQHNQMMSAVNGTGHGNAVSMKNTGVAHVEDQQLHQQSTATHCSVSTQTLPLDQVMFEWLQSDSGMDALLKNEYTMELVDYRRAKRRKGENGSSFSSVH
jgi:hypothetical protein